MPGYPGSLPPGSDVIIDERLQAAQAAYDASNRPGGMAYVIPADMMRNERGIIVYRPGAEPTRDQILGALGAGMTAAERMFAEQAATDRARIAAESALAIARLQQGGLTEAQATAAQRESTARAAADAAAAAQAAALLATSNAAKAGAALGAAPRTDDGSGMGTGTMVAIAAAGLAVVGGIILAVTK